MFHNIDRHLFTRLVTSLGREPGEASPVMAYLIWLEKMSKDFRLVSKLLNWPDHLLNDLVNESILVLNCIGSDHFQHHHENNVASFIDRLPLTQTVTRTTVTLRYLHENRVTIIRAVKKIMTDVCERAFNDIVQKVEHDKAMILRGQNVMMMNNVVVNNNVNNNNNNNIVGGGNMLGNFVYYNSSDPLGLVSQNRMNSEGRSNTSIINNNNVNNVGVNAWSNIGVGGFDVPNASDYNPTAEEILGDNDVINEMFKRLDMNNNMNNNNNNNSIEEMMLRNVAQDDRTIFLTFSKGYPISEAEVRDYFSRLVHSLISHIYSLKWLVRFSFFRKIFKIILEVNLEDLSIFFFNFLDFNNNI